MVVDYTVTYFHDQSYLRLPTEICAGIYDSTSSEPPSANSPFNSKGHSSISGDGQDGLIQFQYPALNPESAAVNGLIPVEQHTESTYGAHDRIGKKKINSYVQSRRRAQNRAAQQAFRDRRQKLVKDLEARLAELQAQYNDLTRLYEALQLEYSIARQELQALQDSTDKHESLHLSPGSYDLEPRDWEEPLTRDFLSSECF